MCKITNDPKIDLELAKSQFESFMTSKKHLKATLIISVFFLLLFFATFSTLILFSFLVSVGDLRRRNLNYRFEKSMLLLFSDEMIIFNDSKKMNSIYHFW